MTTSNDLYVEARVLQAEMIKADNEYSAALKAAYKKNAGDMRYRRDLQPPHIRELSSRYAEVSERWGDLYQRACRAERAEETAT